VIYTFLMAFVTGFTEYWPLVIGAIIILVVLFMPGGVLGLVEEKAEIFRSKHIDDMGDESIHRESS